MLKCPLNSAGVKFEINVIYVILQFMHAYRGKKAQFAFSFHGELSHDSINLVGVADDDIAEWLKYLKLNGLLERTILVMMADHGNRYVWHGNLFTFRQILTM